MRGNKFNIPRDEHDLIEVDSECTDSLDEDYNVSEDNQVNQTSLDQNKDTYNINSEIQQQEQEQEDTIMTPIHQDQEDKERNQDQDQDQDQEDKEVSNDSEQTDDKLDLIKECHKKKKSKSKPGKGRASKHPKDFIALDSDCLDVLDTNNNAELEVNQDNADNLAQIVEFLDIFNAIKMSDLISKRTVTDSDEIELITNQTQTQTQTHRSKFVIPDGFEQNAKKVVAGMFATAVIDKYGELKFWFNRRNDLPAGIRTYGGFSKGKVSLSQHFFCAINDARELSCFRLNPPKAALKRLQTPRSLNGAVLDVSAGDEQICAVSVKSAVTCWTYTSRGVQVLYVPNRLRKPDSALRVHSA